MKIKLYLIILCFYFTNNLAVAMNDWNLNIVVKTQDNLNAKDVSIYIYNDKGRKIEEKSFDSSLKFLFNYKGAHAFRINKKGYKSLYINYIDDGILKEKLTLEVVLGKNKSTIHSKNKNFKTINSVAKVISDFEFQASLKLMQLYSKKSDNKNKKIIDFTHQVEKIEKELVKYTNNKNSIVYKTKLIEYLSYESIKEKLIAPNLVIKTGVKGIYVEDALKYLNPNENLFYLNAELFYAITYKLGNNYGKVADYINEVVEKNQSNHIKSTALKALIDLEYSLGLEANFKNSIAKLFSYFPNEYSTVKVKEEYNINNNLAKGNTIPDFDVTNLINEPFSKLDLEENKLYIIHFWNTKCGGSLNILDRINTNYNASLSAKIEILNFIIDDEVSNIEKFMEHKYTPVGKLLFVKGDFTSKTAIDFNIAYLPRTMLINGKGKILAQKDEIRRFDFVEILNRY